MPKLYPLHTPFVLRVGRHAPGREMCVMEAVSVRAGEPWSDDPATAGPVLSVFMRCWNDRLHSDKERTRLLVPYIDQLVGAAGTPAVEKRRRWLAVDWLVRTCTPAWLDLTPALSGHAAALRGLAEITDDATCAVAMTTMHAARAAGAARAPALMTTMHGDAARVAWGTAWAAAAAAAWPSWRPAAWSHAGVAATVGGAALAPTVAHLQTSAFDLLDRMIAIKEVSS